MNTLYKNTFKIISLILLIALSLVYNQNTDFWQSIENTYFSVLLVLLFSIILIVLSAKEIKLNRLDVVIVALLLLCTVSRILRLEAINEIQILSSLVLVLYYLSVKTIDFKNNENAIYNAGIILVTFALSVFSILEFYQVILPTNFNWRITGNFSNPGPLGGFIAIVIPFVFSKILRSDLKKSTKGFYVMTAFVMAFTIVLSGSRAAIVSVIVAITILAGYYGSKKWKYFKYTPLLIIPIVLIIIFSKGMDSISGRFLIWKITLKSFFEKPIFGIGYDFFKVDYLNFQANYFSQVSNNREVLLAGVNHHAFNEPLKFAMENGLLGIGFVAVTVIWILRTNKVGTNFFKNKTSVSTLMFFGSFFIFALFSYPLQFLPFKLVLLNQLALLNGLPVFYSVKLNKFFTLPLLLLLAFMFYITFYQYNGIRAWKKGSELQFKNPDSTFVFYDLAAQKLKYDGVFLTHYGILEEKKDKIKALKLYEKAVKTYNIPYLYLKMGELNERFQNYSAVENNLQKQHFMLPHMFKPQEQLLDFYVRRHDTMKAKCVAYKILKTPIKIESEEVFRIKDKAKIFIDNL